MDLGLTAGGGAAAHVDGAHAEAAEGAMTDPAAFAGQHPRLDAAHAMNEVEAAGDVCRGGVGKERTPLCGLPLDVGQDGLAVGLVFVDGRPQGQLGAVLHLPGIEPKIETAEDRHRHLVH